MHHPQHVQSYEPNLSHSSHKKHEKHLPHNQYHPNTNGSGMSNNMQSPPSSQHSEQKDDIKEPPQHIGYSSGSNTISPQQSDPNQLRNRSAGSMPSETHPFTEQTVKDMAANLGFEQEYVRMALIQAAGDVAFAAEILCRMSEKTIKAMKKIEKQKRKHKHSSNLNAKLMTQVFGMNVKEVKRAWKLVIGDKSKSDLRGIARRECLDDIDDDSDSSNSTENSDDGSRFGANNSFYKKNKAEIQNTLCQSAQNVLFVLRLYEKWKSVSSANNDSIHFHILIEECLSHYGLIQLINDFEHIHIYHWDHWELFSEFEKMLHECSVPKCVSFQRHFRDRSLYKNDSKRYKLYGLEFIAGEEEALQDRQSMNLKELLCIQWMDEIHCYLMHSLMRFDTDDSDDSEDEEEDETQTDSEHSHSLSVSVNTRKQKKRALKKDKEDQKRKNMKLMMQRKDELVQYGYGRSYGRTDYNEDDKENDEEEDQETLNTFEWQSQSSTQKLTPRFASFRLEILNNPYYTLSMNEWNELNLKSEQISRTWVRKRIKSKEKYKDHMIKIKKSDPISIELIMAIKLYTDYDKLQYELKKCWRTNDNDLCNLYWWNHMLSIVVSKYGIRMKKHRFFYGLNSKHEVSTFCGFGSFCGPLSMTISLEIAKQYAQHSDVNGGMLMQIGNAHPWIKDKESGNGRYFDVSVLSDYKNEHEVMTMLLTTRLHMISCNEYIDANLRNVSPQLFAFVCGLFDRCILSMNYELEQMVIKLIHNQIVKRNKREIPSKYSYRFNKLCNEKEEAMLWDISYGLQDYFMVSTQYDDDFDDDSRSRSLYNMQQNENEEDEDHKLLVSFEKINTIFVNLKALTLINHTLSNEIFYQFIDYLNKNEGTVSYEIITFYFPKYKKLPLNLKINQLHHVWNQYLIKYNYVIEAYKYGTEHTLSPMIVIKKIGCNRMPFVGENDHNIFVKIEK
eukprot:155626_1